MKIEYYSDDGIFVACINNGFDGMFICRSSKPGSTWEFIQSGTVMWDSLHQEIYRNGGFDSCEINQTRYLPPLPPIPENKPVKWRDNFIPENDIKSIDYPNIEKNLGDQIDNSQTLYIILSEDRYETILGDGEFLYYKNLIYFTESDADKYALENSSEERLGRKYHVRSIKIKLDGGTIIPVIFECDIFEHFKLLDILMDLENILSSSS